MRIRAPRGSARSVPLVLLLLAGCGGEPGEPRAQSETQPPRLEASVAERLAARSDVVSQQLAAGDVCGAAQEADGLNAAAIEAVNAGAVPPAYQEELLARTQELVNAVNCPEPEPEPEPTDEDEQESDEQDAGEGDPPGKAKGKDKDKDKDKDDEEGDG
jgi:hypothetical protein